MRRAVTAPGRLRRRSPMSLGAKLVAMLTAIGLLGAIAITLLLARVITPGFERLEQEAVEAHVQRTRATLHDYAADVQASARRYGDWSHGHDATGATVGLPEHDGFDVAAPGNLQIDGVAYVAADGRIVGARWIGLDTDREVARLRARMMSAVDRLDLNRLAAGDRSSGFYMRLGDRVAAFGVANVRRAGGDMTRGHIVMARLLTSRQLSRLLQLPARLDLAGPVPDATVVRRQDETAVAVPVRGHDGKPVASATYVVPRALSALGRSMLTLAAIGTTALLLVLMAGLSWMIARLVLRPLNRVERHMALVRKSGTIAPFADTPRRDEIGRLVVGFNAMLSQLQGLRERVEAQSFKLGQSESAVAVMHNVRNALNPLSTVLSQGMAQPPAADRALLEQALTELAGDDIPIARRRKLVAFLAAALERGVRARESRNAQLQIGREALHNVLEIIGQQQAQANERPPLDACDATDIVARNATIARYSGGSSIAFHFPSRPHWVLANRVLLSQVIGNLFANAAEAIAATGRDGGSIAVTIKTDGDRVDIVIRDDGEGFDPAGAPRLFQRGYSTRKDKSGGLGLHWCANSAASMGGSLSLKSEGRGLGARAIVSLQASRVTRAAEAA